MPHDFVSSDPWSYWDRSVLLRKQDLAIIGSGIVGLSAAITAKEKYPELEIMVLERGHLPHGASTRNAGFACIGSISELYDDLKNDDPEEVFNLVKNRKAGLDLLISRVGKKTLELQQHGGFEIFTDKNMFDIASSQIHFFNQNLKEITGLSNTFSVCSTDLNTELGIKLTLPMIKNLFEAQINTGKMMEALLNICQRLGVRILNATKLVGYEEHKSYVSMQTEPFGELKASRILICTNGFAEEIISDSGVKPARAQVLITSPIENLKLRGTFHMDSGYFYFRDIDKRRVLIGGGRNLDFKGEETTVMEVSSLIQNKLEELLREIILPDTSFDIEHRWAGIMGVGSIKSPVIKMLGKRSACAVRMGGMGVALGSSAGAEGARLILES